MSFLYFVLYCAVVMLSTLLNQVFRHSTSSGSQQTGRNNGISIKIFLYCSIPAMFFSSSLTMFITSLATHGCTSQNCTDLVMGNQVSAALNVSYPLPDSYVQSLTMRYLNKTELKYDGKDVCLLRSFLKSCLKPQASCWYKDLAKAEIVALYEMFEKLVLC